MEAVAFFLQKHAFQKKLKDINAKVFNMITKKMKLKQWEKIFNVNVNANSIVQHVIQFKSEIMKHLNVSVNVSVIAKKIIVGILAHTLVRIVFKNRRRLFKNCVWWNYICYGYCINKNYKYYSNKCVNKLSEWTSWI